jgi:hypothetical protein
VPAFPSSRILIITDAWLPQINGVVRSIEALVREAPALEYGEVVVPDCVRVALRPLVSQIDALDAAI